MKTFVIPVLTGLLAVAGCQTSVNTVEPAQPMAQRRTMPDKRVITDPDLGRAVHVFGVNTMGGSGGFLKVQLQVQNLTYSRKSFTYKIEWDDENGMAIQLPTTASIPMSLEGRETSSILTVAPTPLARDFRISFLPSAN